jgi:hypothetical protein
MKCGAAFFFFRGDRRNAIGRVSNTSLALSARNRLPWLRIVGEALIDKLAFLVLF